MTAQVSGQYFGVPVWHLQRKLLVQCVFCCQEEEEEEKKTLEEMKEALTDCETMTSWLADWDHYQRSSTRALHYVVSSRRKVETVSTCFFNLHFRASSLETVMEMGNPPHLHDWAEDVRMNRRWTERKGGIRGRDKQVRGEDWGWGGGRCCAGGVTCLSGGNNNTELSVRKVRCPGWLAAVAMVTVPAAPTYRLRWACARRCVTG